MDIFALAERRLGWIGHRQQVLAQNIANASTPGYVARDVRPFEQALAEVPQSLATTHAGHIVGSTTNNQYDRSSRPSERAPDGNAVSLDEQLTKVADTDGAQALVINLYHTYLNLFRTTIGK